MLMKTFKNTIFYTRRLEIALYFNLFIKIPD